MIAANELRVGNLANNGFKDYQVSGATIWHLETGNATALPIPLTEEWLLRFGFKKGVKYWSYNGFDVDFKEWFGFNKMVAKSPLKHVHQLQNLYFSITGEELTIKEK